MVILAHFTSFNNNLYSYFIPATELKAQRGQSFCLTNLCISTLGPSIYTQ